MPTFTDTPAIRAHREACEAAILQLLKTLCHDTGLDLEAVTVRTLVQSAADRDEPQAVPFAVKIILGV
jgi:hypothetical protein